MAAAVGSDIDSFIREQKSKLAHERNALNPRRDIPRGQNTKDGDDYKDIWRTVHPKTSPRAHYTQAPSSDNYGGRGRGGVDIDTVAERAEKKRELADAMQQKQREGEQTSHRRRQWHEDKTGHPLPNSDDKMETARKKLAEDRKKDYQEMIDKSPDRGNRRRWEVPETADAEQPFALGQYDSVRQQKQQERKEEYKKFLQSKNAGNRDWREPSSEKLLLTGETEGKRKQLENERNKDYNEYLKQQQHNDRRSLVQQTDEYKASNFPGMNESDNDKMQKQRDRNREYNDFLANKGGGRRGRGGQDGGEPEYGATLPGLGDSQSAKRRKEQQRNVEYNQFLASKMMPAKADGRPPPAPKRGWATPTYDEMLEKKRQQEAQYRRSNDPGYDQPLESDRKLNALDKQLDAKKAQFQRERSTQGLLEDPNWLTPRRGANDAKYDQLPTRQRQQEAPHKESSFYATLPIGGKSTDNEIQRQKERYRHELEQQIREAADGKRREKQQELRVAYSAVSGPLGGAGERTQDMKVDYSGFHDPEAVLPSGRRSKHTHVEPYHSKILDDLAKLDQISPRSNIALGRKRLEDYGGGGGLNLGAPLNLSRGPSRGGTAILDSGFDTGILEAPRISTLAPPPGLEYQPASYITQGGGGLGMSSVDEAYNFYATRNPLDDMGGFAGPRGGGGGDGGGRSRARAPEQELTFGGFGGGGGGGGGTARSSTKVRFNDEAPRRATGQMDFPTDDDKKKGAQSKARAYQEELEQQIQEKNRKKMKDKEEKDRFDRRLEQEALEYNPYGKGGGGAPIRDAYGNLVSDLRQMKKGNDDPDAPPKRAYQSPRAPAPYQSPRGGQIRDDLIGPPPVQTTAGGEQTYARGGHGIFGNPKTDTEKVASEKYKDDLKRQIEERKMEEMRKRNEERQEEEREQRRIEEQQTRMKAEYEEEKRRAMEKEEEARRRNEELIRQAEERKREAERRRREEEDRRAEDDRRDREAEMNARLAEARGASPPVPAARRNTDDPLPSTSKQEPPRLERAASGDVLNQLAQMRQQLQNERARVENMLTNERNEPDVFDPRLVQRPPPAPVTKPDVDVFEMSRNRNAVQVRRTPADRANSQALEDFNALRHKSNTDSRKEFNKLFPDDPMSGDILEAQQAVLLQKQEDNLRRLREQRAYDSGYPKTNLIPASRSQSRTPQQLHSDSAFVDVDSVNHFPDDFDDIPASRRNDSARSRRRNANYNRRDSSPRMRTPRLASQGYTDGFGSQASLNVDRLAKKNEERLKRLNDMKGDDISLYEADDVLDRFMSKQAHNRPPSGQTLQDDTWMFAGSKMSGY